MSGAIIGDEMEIHRMMPFFSEGSCMWLAFSQVFLGSVPLVSLLGPQTCSAAIVG
jgi:hypothetical protein